MDLEERIISFSRLGNILRNALGGHSGKYGEKIRVAIEKQQDMNPWFTPDNVRQALSAVASKLTEENIRKWTSAYPLLSEYTVPARVGVIMAGNIPLVGFHDFLSVLISGNNIIAKTSSKDSQLIKLMSEILCSINNKFSQKIEFSENALTDFDAIIATGSNNSSRYFEYYFGKYPHIIRKNRNSIAIIEGMESDVELKDLGNDIFSYFGLGCRNVSKIYLPKGFDIRLLDENWKGIADVINHNKYASNYDFNKAVFLVNKENFYDTGFLLLKESDELSSPVAVVFYEFYDTREEVNQQTDILKDKIQCIVSRDNIPFGKAQSPQLWDYSDGIDTIDFLLKKIRSGIL
jgi:hypothetical protein